MSRIVYSSDNPPARKGWDDFDREVEKALEDIGRPAAFDEVAERLPEGVPYAWILTSLRAVAECRNRRWRTQAPASVVDLPSRTLTTTTRKAA